MSAESDIRIIDKAVSVCQEKPFLYKFISANDVGKTGSHQSGFYIPYSCWPLIFDKPGQKGKNTDRFVRISWNDKEDTRSRFIWYGKGTRREYRLTRLGKGFEYLKDKYIGSLLIIAKESEDTCQGFVLDTDDDIEQFMARFNIMPSRSYGLIRPEIPDSGETGIVPGNELLEKYNLMTAEKFPDTKDIAAAARDICRGKGQPSDADEKIITWLDTEYSLFKYIEESRYTPLVQSGFQSVEKFLDFAQTVLNRRKSRAGKSLEHHLNAIFQEHHLSFTPNCVTEGNKKPDFIFPGCDQYHDSSFPEESLVFLAAKTTCKDRWRQILNEADRIKTRHLFTLQQGVSPAQLDEMARGGVQLVVPKKNIPHFPEKYRTAIMTLGMFIRYTREKTGP